MHPKNQRNKMQDINYDNIHRFNSLIHAADRISIVTHMRPDGDAIPDTVPSHFNFAGEIDGWSGKEVYWILAAVFLLMMIICASAAYNRKLVNLPIRLKEAVFYRQIGLISRMCRIMTLVSGVIWLSVLLAMSTDIVGLPLEVAVSFIPMAVVLMLGVVLFYTLKIWWIGRGL